MPQRTAYYVEMTSNAGVMVQMVEAAVDSLASTLGYTKCPTGEPPANKTAIGQGRADVLAGGGSLVNLVYLKNGKPQTAKVLVSPTKSSPSLFGTLKGKTYSGNNIVNVRVPRRRIYSY